MQSGVEVKVFEFRDRATFIPFMGVKLCSDQPKERWLLLKGGRDSATVHQIQLTNLNSMLSYADPYKWEAVSSRFIELHNFIADNWDELKTGDVLDIEYILGEVEKPKVSEFEY